MNGYRIFKKGSYDFNPFKLDKELLDNTYEVTLSEYGGREDLSCGFFRMTENSFEIVYPNDEVMLIMEGEVVLVAGKDRLDLRAGDIIQVKEGLKATVSTKSSVEIFFVGYPVREALESRG
jgi:ethanolamine utilization protein EutQ (cupin superfamily)